MAKSKNSPDGDGEIYTVDENYCLEMIDLSAQQLNALKAAL